VKALLASVFRRAASILSSSETVFDWGDWMSGEVGGVELDEERDVVVDCSLIFMLTWKFFIVDLGFF
jgi:hypothetical protein